MALKKKRIKVPTTIPSHLRRKRKLLRQHALPDYSNLFQTLSRKEFIDYIFHKPFCAIHYAKTWIMDYSLTIKSFNKIVNYFHEDDLYNYFVINHSLHFNLDKEKYRNTFFRVITDLGSQVPNEIFESFEDDNSVTGHIYVYGITKYKDNSLINLSRELFYYERTPWDMKRHIQLPFLKKNLKEIYQEGLMPIDISQKSYLF